MFKKIFENKRNIVVFSVLGVFLILGATYALINWTSNNYSVAIRSTCMNINYSKGQDIDSNITAIKESQFINLSDNTLTVSPDMVFSTISIELDEECSDIEGFVTLEVNVSNLSNDLKSNGAYHESLRYNVVEYNPSDYDNLNIDELTGDEFTILSKGSINNNGTIDIHHDYIKHGEIHNYLIFFYADSTLFGSNYLELSFGGTISAKVEQFIMPINDFDYTINGNDIVLTNYKGSSSIIKVPSTFLVNGIEYNTKVAAKLFKDMTFIEEVFFENDVLSNNGNISSMFSGCTKLKKMVNLPQNAKIMSNIFSGCTSLEYSPEIPDSVTDLFAAFSGCTNLVKAPEIPDSVTSLNSAFSGCTNLVNVPEIPDSVISLYSAFYRCTNLVNVPEIPNSVTDMSQTFYGCTNLVNVPEIPNSVTNMSQTFFGCSNLQGTIRITSSNLTSNTTAPSQHTFGSTSKPITVEVPEGSSTYTSMIRNKPSNVTIVEY